MATAPLLDDAAPTESAPDRPSNVQRLVAGLGQSVVGPANVARALSGIGFSLAGRAIAALVGLIRSWIAPAEVDPDRAITLSDGPAPRGLRKPILITLAVAAVLAIGGVAFKLLRTPKAPPVAPEPPRVRAVTGATADSAPVTADDADETAGTEQTGADEAQELADLIADDDPRKKGE